VYITDKNVVYGTKKEKNREKLDFIVLTSLKLCPGRIEMRRLFISVDVSM